MQRGELPRIQHKSDEGSLRQLRDLGYPAVAPVIPHLLDWIKDPNWPICRHVTEFLASIGAPVIPEIRRVLQGSDDIWKLSCLYLLKHMDSQTTAGLTSEITRLAVSPTAGEVAEDVPEVARDLLVRLNNPGSR